MREAPEPTPEEEREVSELLADVSASWSAPLPPEVSDRLEATLADLVSERGRTGHGATTHEVVPLAGRRVSRRWPRALLAAAAVLAGGFAVGNVVERSAVTSGDDSAGSESTQDLEGAGDGALDDGGAGAAEDDRNAPEGVLPETLGDKPPPDAVTTTRGLLVAEQPVRLRSDRLVRDVRGVLVALDTGEYALDTNDLASARFRCAEPASADRGLWLAARYDGERASLVLTQAEGGPVVGRVYDCDDATVVDRVDLAGWEWTGP